jgi:hypothetical protein
MQQALKNRKSHIMLCAGRIHSKGIAFFRYFAFILPLFFGGGCIIPIIFFFPGSTQFYIVNLDENDYLLSAENKLWSRQWKIEGKSVYRGSHDLSKRYRLNDVAVEADIARPQYSPCLKFYFEGKTMSIKEADFGVSMGYWEFVYSGFLYKVPHGVIDENGTFHYLYGIWSLSDEEIIEFIGKNKNFFLDERQPKPQYLNPKSGGL